MSHYMPPPRFSRVYHIQVKTHKLTIMHSGLAPTTLLSEIKSETLSALKSNVAHDSLDAMAMEPPEIDVETEDDFELCRAVKERGKPTGKYEPLEVATAIKDHGLAGWDTLYLQFRDRATGDLKPITYVRPLIYDEDDNAPPAAVELVEPAKSKGKRKADDIEEVSRASSESRPLPLPASVPPLS